MEATLPALPLDRIQRVPGGAAAMGDVTHVKWQVCTLIGARLMLQDQHVNALKAGSKYYQDEVVALEKQHKEKFENLLVSVPALAGGAQGSRAPGQRLQRNTSHFRALQITPPLPCKNSAGEGGFY